MSAGALLKAFLAAALAAAVQASAAGPICYVDKVALREKHATGEPPELLVFTSGWAWGFSITRRDGSKTGYQPMAARERYWRESQQRTAEGLEPLPPPDELLLPPHVVLRDGDVAYASIPHNACTFTASRSNGRVGVELEASYCRDGRCDKAHEFVAAKEVIK